MRAYFTKNTENVKNLEKSVVHDHSPRATSVQVQKYL